jgi:DNA-binding FadR family transcriptional regulator
VAVTRRIRDNGAVKRKAARIVADALQERILAAEFVPGDFLPPVDELMDEFDVSRPTLREALNLLESAGFVRLKRGPGGGTVVRTPDQSEVVRALDALLRYDGTTPFHIMEVRLVLEPAAARMAALRGTEEELEQLAASLERQQLDAVMNEPRLWFAEKLEFHSVLARMSRNPVISVLTDSLRELVIQANLEANYTLEARQLAVEHEQQILKHLRARNSKAAEAAVRRHLEQSYLLPDTPDPMLKGLPVRRIR